VARQSTHLIDPGLAGAAWRALGGIAIAIGLAAGAASAAQGPSCAAGACGGFDWQALGDGLYAAIRREPPALLEHANSLVIVNDTDVIVVDSQMTVAATRELIRAIRRVTAKPVRYVVMTHWHDDHAFGSAAYVAAYPGVEFIASAATRADLETLGRDNRRQFMAALPGELRLMRHHLDAGTALDWRDLSRDGPPLDDAGRRSLESGVRQATEYLAQEPATRPVSPEVIVDGELVLYRGVREIRVLCLGAAHTRGDVVVWLPREGVLAAGDVVSGIVPMAAATADLAAWSRALDRLGALAPRWIVPGHGPVEAGTGLLQRTKLLLDTVLERTAAAYRPGAAWSEVRSRVQLDDLRQQWSAGDAVRELLFALFFEDPAVESAYRHLSGSPTS